MELMFLVYAVENLTYGGSLFLIISITLLVICGVIILFGMLNDIGENDPKFLTYLTEKAPKRMVVSILIVLMSLHTLLPTRQTAIYMASAYAVQQVVTADQTKELASRGYSALSAQLVKWSEEVPEVADMLVDAGLEVAKKELTDK